MKMILIVIAVILVGCNAPKIKILERRIYSSDFGVCLCQRYDLNRVESLEEAEECDIEKCNDMVGFSARSWAKYITPWGKEMAEYGNDSCK